MMNALRTSGALVCLFAVSYNFPACGADFRNFQTAHPVPHEAYCDQPYIVVTKDGHWLCLMTTGPGKEGERGQHIVATISEDRGRTWSKLIDIEPSDGPAASWVVPLLTPGGRVYAFYTYNGDRIETLHEKPVRVDTLGWLVYKYSDDGGWTWSAQRYRIPMRVTACDRGNDWQGRVQLFWGIDKPIWVGQSALFGFTKLGKHHMENGEGWIFRCNDLFGEGGWDMLPDGDVGIRAPQFGSCQEEHNIVALSNDSLYCIYRTDLGFPCHSYSRDGGRTWTTPQPASYTPGGRIIRHPRACPMVWQAANGKYLLWYQNNGVTRKSKRPNPPASPRNMVWLTAGEERNGYIHWCQPELVCYCPNPLQGCSYPDLIEQDGQCYLSSTQKTEARVQAIDSQLIEDLWRQNELKSEAKRGCLLSVSRAPDDSSTVAMPRLPNLSAGGGFTIDLWMELADLAPGQVVLDSCDSSDRGITVTTADRGSLLLTIRDGRASAAWDSDPGLIQPAKLHHVAFIVDAAPKMISVVVDGLLCDGGDDPERVFGYGRFLQTRYVSNRSDEIKTAAREIGDVSGGPRMKIGPSVKHLRLYDRYLRTTEAIGNYRCGTTSLSRGPQ